MKYVLFFLINIGYAYSQFLPKEFTGILRVHDSTMISYKIYLEKNIATSSIEGYSITGIDGPHETKSLIRGTYSSKDKVLSFEEYDIVYTKSSYDELDFCFIHFTQEVKDFNSLKKLKGNFNGKYVDGTKCVDGEIIVVESSKLEKKIEKLKKRLDKPKFQNKIAPKVIDTIKLESITNKEELNVVVKSEVLILSIYDSGKIDGDRINLYINGELVLEDFTIEKEKKQIPIKIKGKKTSIRVEALNEGSSSPNTVKVELNGPSDYLETKTTLIEGENAYLTLIKK